MTDHQSIMNPAPDNPDWATHATQPASKASLCGLVDADPDTMTGPALLDAIAASEKALSYLAAKQLRLLTAFAKPFTAGDPTRLAAAAARKHCATGDDDPDKIALFIEDAAESLAAAEVAAALRIPTTTAGHRVRYAKNMTGTLAPTLHALQHGVLDQVKARVIADHCQPLTPEHTTTVQHLVLPTAGDLTTSELRDRTGHAVITVDPDGAEERHQVAAARRELALQALPDAMATLKAYLPADGAVKIFQVSDLLATGTAATPGDTRGIGARRIDALIDIADELLTNGYLDLTDYLGRELPNHTTPTRTRTTSTTAADHTDTDHTDAGHTDGTRTGARASATTPDGDADDHRGHPGTEPAGDADDDGDDDDADDDDDVEVQTEELIHHHDHEAAPQAAAADSDARVDEPEVVGAESNAAEVNQVQVNQAQADTTEGTSVTAETATPATTDAPGRARKPRPGKPTARVFTRQGRRPHLSVTLGLGTLAGLDNLPGTLAGFGAIPAALARSIATSAGTITALLTNPDTGTVTAAGALTYRPTQDLRDRIAALVDTCRFPSCRQPVWRCEFDHRDPFDHQHPENGGKTNPENIDPYCKRHHLFKHHTQWQVRPDPDRTVLHFTSPTGHHYSKHGRQTAPPQLWVDTVGADSAEHLDTIINRPTTLIHPEPRPASRVEEFLTNILIRHALTTRPIEYQPDDTAWHPTTTNHQNGQPGGSGDNPDTDPWNDAPPF